MITDNLAFQILISLMVIGFLIAWHELGHYWMARLTGMRVIRFSIGFGPKLIQFVKNKIEYRISIFPIGGYVQIAGMTSLEEGAKEDPKSFINRPKWTQILVIFAGPLFNYLMAFILFFCVFWLWSFNQTPSLLINQVAPQSAAFKAGLQEGDIITHIDKSPIHTTQDFLTDIQNSLGNALNFTIECSPNSKQEKKEILNIEITPQKDSSGIYRIGLSYVPLSFNFTGAIKESFFQIANQSTGILTQLGQAIFAKSTSQLGGIVEITKQLSHATQQGFKNLLWLMASLSVALGLFNILPIPALDGSKIFILCLEAIMRRPIPEKAQIGINVIGIILILVLMLLLTVSDVLKIYNAS